MIHHKYIHPEQFRFSFTKVQQTSLIFLHQKQIIQEMNNLLIILKVSTFHFIQFNEGASKLLHYKQIIQEANNLFLMSQMVLLCTISNDCMAPYWGPRGEYVMSYKANAILKT